MSDDAIDFDDTTPEGLKSLRKAYEKLQTTLKEERTSNAALAAKQRTRDIADKLTELGAKPGLADLVPEKIEVETLGAWLTEKADLFGWKPAQPQANPANAAEQEAQSRVSQISQGLPGESPDDPDLKAIYEAKDPKALADLIYARQLGVR